MAQAGHTSIVTYNTATASAAPVAGNLAQGELAVNVTDRKLYTKNSGGSVVPVADTADQTHAATSKATPVDTDEIPLLDSAASWVLKKLTWANLKAALSASATPGRNVVLNSNFGVNQRRVSGTVTLAAGAYGIDGWKGGASGCTYTFATSGNITILTISAGSLVQVIEGGNLQTETMCLSWTGTSTGKIGAGSYSASGVTGSVTGGTDVNIEFSTGTLTKVKFESGSVASTYQVPDLAIERGRCLRWYFRLWHQGLGATICYGVATSATQVRGRITFPSEMRAAPVISSNTGSLASYHVFTADSVDKGAITSAVTSSQSTPQMGSLIYNIASGLTAGTTYSMNTTDTDTAYVAWSSEP